MVRWSLFAVTKYYYFAEKHKNATSKNGAASASAPSFYDY